MELIKGIFIAVWLFNSLLITLILLMIIRGVGVNIQVNDKDTK